MMEDLSLHVLDIAENSIAAGATLIIVTINESRKRNLLTLRVADNGRGMSRAELRRARDPFFTTKEKRTGLGLPLLAQTAEQCGGGLTITTRPGKGTRVEARFFYRHIDRPPLTNMRGTMMALVFGHPEIDFRYRHRRDGRIFAFASRRFIPARLAAGGLAPETIGRVRRHLGAGLRRIGTT
ncbi:MAG: ATP-binding protein [Candidatus Aminicenantes bacterium]|nr:ATP-binding protein [Candidatus Aminicenantes bacterium]